MKKIFLLAVATVAVFSAYAQDVIITRDAKRVEAKILEVSSSEIKYKEFNNQEGPTFVLTTGEINTIIYQNGTVKVFDQQPRQAAPAYGAAPAYAPAYGTPQATGTPIVRNDDNYIMGDVRMTEDQYVAFIQQNCTQAYEQYMKGQKLRKSGWGLFASGLTFMGVGSVLYGVGYGLGGPKTTYSKYGSSSRFEDESLFLGMGIPGAILLGAGSGLFVASIPCIVVGTVKRNNSYELYNQTCARQTALEFGIQTSQNGVGLAMKF
jgi:hypothetical protein